MALASIQRSADELTARVARLQQALERRSTPHAQLQDDCDDCQDMAIDLINDLADVEPASRDEDKQRASLSRVLQELDHNVREIQDELDAAAENVSGGAGGAGSRSPSPARSPSASPQHRPRHRRSPSLDRAARAAEADEVQAGESDSVSGSLDSSNDYSDGEEDDDGSSLDAASLDARGPAVSSDAQIVALAKAMYSFKGTKQDDLTFEVGDMFAVIDRHVAPDWWLVEEQRSDGSAGKRGYAPEAYLQIVADNQQALALPGGAAGAGGMGSQPDLLHPDAPMEVPGTPAAAVRLASMSASKDHPLQRRRSSPKQHWLKLKQHVQMQTAVDRLRQARAIPSGFRSSTLATIASNPDYLLSSWLRPKFNLSCLAFEDLQLDNSTGKLASAPVPVNRTFVVQEARGVPQPRDRSLVVTSRHLRVVLFDKQHFLSNVVLFRAVCLPDSQRVWRFDKLGPFPGARDTDRLGLCRSSSTNADLNLLFELSMTVTQEGGEGSVRTEEISCGWAQLPLFRHTGQPSPSETYELQLHGGTPFEPEVPLLDEQEQPKRTSRFFGPGGGGYNSRIIVKLMNLKKTLTPLCNHLPQTILTQISSVPLISLYREIQADILLAERTNAMDVSAMCHAALEVFPQLADRPHLMSNFKSVWNDQLKALKRSQKKDPEFVKTWFQTVLVQKMWPLLHMDVPEAEMGDLRAERERQTFIQRFIQRDSIDALFEPNSYSHAPFDASEITYDLMDTY